MPRSFSEAAREVRTMKMKKRELRAMLVFLLPALALLTLFIIVPFLMAFGLSFTNQRLISGRIPTKFIGLLNYERMLRDDLFFKGFGNTFIFAAVVVPLQTAFALGLAMLVNKRLKGAKVFRTTYFMPTVTVMVVVAVIWTFLYHPEGLINGFLEVVSFGKWEPMDFLNNERWAFPAIMFMSIWQGVGFQMLIFLAGLQEIPQSLYEAATIDGANKWKQFLHITLPQLRNTTTFVIIATTILALRLFDQVMVMTQGGPRGATYTIMLHIYNMGFKRLNVGYASALTVIFFLVVLGLSLLQKALLGEERG